jgi:hypothetical protein
MIFSHVDRCIRFGAWVTDAILVSLRMTFSSGLETSTAAITSGAAISRRPPILLVRGSEYQVFS